MADVAKYRLPVIAASLTLLLGAVIAVLTLAPISSTAVPGSDKLHHAIAFAALAFPVCFARPRLILPVTAAVIAYGGAIELLQPQFGRTAEWADFWADCVGAVIGSAVGAQVGVWHQRYRFSRSRPQL